MSTREALLDEVARHEWLYSVDLGGGVMTPGRFGPPNPQIKEAVGLVDFPGKDVLDVGCFEGQWAFEAEKRGAASVLATDYLLGDPRALPSDRGVKELPTFRLAHRILGSRVDYRPDVSVYDVTRLERDFDIVFFCGVYYHLKHPLLALSRLREVTREGGTLIVEGPVVEGPSEPYARFYYHDVLAEDRSNWWVPTLSCLLEWIECSYFEIVRVSKSTLQEVRPVRGADPPKGRRGPAGGTERIVRHTILARAVTRRDPGYVLPDEDLQRFDRG